MKYKGGNAMDFVKLPHYVGTRRPNPDYHHGQLPPVKGVCCYQVTRANRTHPEYDDGVGGTYKHGADLAFWKGKFYVHYLTNPCSEHTGAGSSVLGISDDGIHWNRFQTAFPPHKIPQCSVKDRDGNETSHSGEDYAVVHQRVGFYRTADDRLLLLGFYGWSPKPWMVPWDKRGIGRVVRELYEDGSMGPIYFLRVCGQAGWTEDLLLYPLYQNSPDKGFVDGCEELLHNSLAVQQWAEENGDADGIIHIKHDGASNQAFCWYHVDEKTIVGLWKHSRVARSDDGGISWTPVTVSPSLVMSGQKIWGQKCGDGTYALVYDPTLESTHRWPMCVVNSKDGYAFDDMLLVHGEVPPMRFGGFWKDMGPQYMRGISEGFERPEDAVWVAYSVNKEDIWVARIPVPIAGEETEKEISGFEDFGLYSPKWSSAKILSDRLRLRDADPYDYSKAERVLHPAKELQLEFSVKPHQNDHGELWCELQDDMGQTAVRLIFRSDGMLCRRTTAVVPVCGYEAGDSVSIRIRLKCETRRYTLEVNGENTGEANFMTAVDFVSKFVLRTGAPRLTPTREDDPIEDPAYILPGCDEKMSEAVFDLTQFHAISR